MTPTPLREQPTGRAIPTHQAAEHCETRWDRPYDEQHPGAVVVEGPDGTTTIAAAGDRALLAAMTRAELARRQGNNQ